LEFGHFVMSLIFVYSVLWSRAHLRPLSLFRFRKNSLSWVPRRTPGKKRGEEEDYNNTQTNFTTPELIDHDRFLLACTRVSRQIFFCQTNPSFLTYCIPDSALLEGRRVCRPVSFFLGPEDTSSDALRATGVVCLAAVRAVATVLASPTS
jgi:hypothetical protein